MTITKTWTFLTGFENWTFVDASTANADALRSHVTGAIRSTMIVDAAAGDRTAIGHHDTPTLNVLVTAGDSIVLDYGAESAPEGAGAEMQLTAVYTDVTSSFTSKNDFNAGSVTHNPTPGKTIDYIRILNQVGFSGFSPGADYNSYRDFLEVRFTFVGTGFDIKIPSVTSNSQKAFAMNVNQSGTHLFFAMEDIASNQVIYKIDRPTSTSPVTVKVYEPGGGTDGNIAKTGNLDRMLFYGNFGTDIGVIDHAIAAVSNTDISPTSIGAKLIQPLRADPGDIQHIIAINRDDQDAIETEDGGSNWVTLNATLGQNVDAMDMAFHGPNFPDTAFFGGNDGVDENLEYTPNEFADLREDTSAALKAVGSIVSIDLA